MKSMGTIVNTIPDKCWRNQSIYYIVRIHTCTINTSSAINLKSKQKEMELKIEIPPEIYNDFIYFLLNVNNNSRKQQQTKRLKIKIQQRHSICPYMSELNTAISLFGKQITQNTKVKQMQKKEIIGEKKMILL